MTTSRERSPSTHHQDITWYEVGILCQRLVDRVLTSCSDIKVVAGIKRGGVIPGTIIAHLLGTNFRPVADQYDLMDFDPRKVLLIDDVCDTGETLAKFIVKGGPSNQFHTAVLLAKPWILDKERKHIFVLDYIAEWTEDWVVFPWEK